MNNIPKIVQFSLGNALIVFLTKTEQSRKQLDALNK